MNIFDEYRTWELNKHLNSEDNHKEFKQEHCHDCEKVKKLHTHYDKHEGFVKLCAECLEVVKDAENNVN
jgi:hypothetical protein